MKLHGVLVALGALTACLPHVFVRDGAAAGACDDAALGSPVDFCASLPALAAAPVIDGVPECGITLRAMPTSLTFPTDTAPPGDVAIAYAAGWRPDGLYVFVRVHTGRATLVSSTAGDPLLYCYDAVELYVDDDAAFGSAPLYDDPGTRQFIIAAPPPGTATAASGVTIRNTASAGETSTPWGSSTFVARTTPDGYDVEALIVAGDLGLSAWPLVAGRNVGLDVAVDVGRAPGADGGLVCNPPANTRAAEVVLRLAPGTGAPPNSDVAAFCTPQLTAR